MPLFLSALIKDAQRVTRNWGQWLMQKVRAAHARVASTKERRLSESSEWPQSGASHGATSVISNGEDLLAFAEAHVSEEDRRPGRRATVHGSRQVWDISPKTLERIKAALYQVARHFDPEVGSSPARLREALRRHVGPELFVWDSRAGVGGAGDWGPFLEIVEEATKASKESVGAARSLLDLAATHCLIPRTVRHDPQRTSGSAAWTELQARWTELIRGRTDRIHEGVGGLLDGCHRVGADPNRHMEAENWSRVIAHLEEHFHIEKIDARMRSAVRGAYTALLQTGVIDGPGWNATRRRRRQGVILVSQSHIKQIAEAYGQERRQPGVTAAIEALETKRRVEELHPWPGCESYHGLVEGPFGLRAALLSFTAPQYALNDLDLPAPSSYPRDDSQIRTLTGNSKKRWRTATCETNLRLIFFYAGWLRQQERVDFSQPDADLRVLLDEQNVRAFHRAVCAGKVATENQLRRTLVLLARLASPFAEGVAVRLRAIELADRFKRVSGMTNSSQTVDGFVSLNRQVSENLGDPLDRTREIARDVEDLWTDGGRVADFAYDQMEKVKKTLIQLIQKKGRGTLQEMVTSTQQGSFKMSKDLALLIRSTLMWADQLQIPLRPATMVLMDFEDRIHNDAFERLNACIPGWKFKDGKQKPFRPNYRRDPRSPYPTRLYRLYVMPGGARDILRMDRRGKMHPTEAFYVPSHPGQSRLSPNAPQRIVRTALKRALEVKPNYLGGLQYEDLKPVTTSHKFRHAFATRLVAAGLVEEATHCLRHWSTEMVRRVYSAIDERDHDPGASLHKPAV